MEAQQKQSEPEVITKEEGQVIDTNQALANAVNSKEFKKTLADMVKSKPKAASKPAPKAADKNPVAPKPKVAVPAFTVSATRTMRTSKIEKLNKELRTVYAREAYLLEQIRKATM